jgi:hypothetical protein
MLNTGSCMLNTASCSSFPCMPSIRLAQPVRWIALLFGLAAGACLAGEQTSASTAPPLDRAIHWAGNITPPRIEHEARVIKLALEKSRDKYGPYTYEISFHRFSHQRVERAMRDGTLVNVASSPVWRLEEHEDPPLRVIPIPVARGLLGYRQLVVRKEDFPRFAKLKTLEELQKMTAGVGIHWTELNVFRENNLPWLGGKDIAQLHFMLARSRLDYIPLGIAEVTQELAESPYRDELAIVPDLIIYYPLPTFIQVSLGTPHLAERIEYGLRRSVADGSLDKLFQRHYGHLTNTLQSPELRVIMLKNPDLPSFVEDKGPILMRQ